MISGQVLYIPSKPFQHLRVYAYTYFSCIPKTLILFKHCTTTEVLYIKCYKNSLSKLSMLPNGKVGISVWYLVFKVLEELKSKCVCIEMWTSFLYAQSSFIMEKYTWYMENFCFICISYLTDFNISYNYNCDSALWQCMYVYIKKLTYTCARETWYTWICWH